MSKNYTTISIEKDTLEELKNLEVDFHGFQMKTNSDKIKALIKLHKTENNI